ncbi:MAG TPA: tRNA (adenosine(37)-N6)-threonylcarbamoyltransferase complex ATPase subunit type 1 TsaE [Candidatus Solibacter sp.]|jgi:tRNA threonylcarbamoyladenosine biosynthesis protein TsaE|nr:tRNA (adenosine(37)-N6)-threonylcarbamoyltransferase complex ATPase subunit type 1 TsaE [Candidatus Solibacter sp.]
MSLHAVSSRLVARSAAETESAGRRLGEVAAAGDVLLLDGPLGAGKTVLVRGIAAGLGWDGEVGSPTFVLVRQYPGRLELVHADLYRLEDRQEIDDLGLLDLSAGGVLAVEWADRAPWLAIDGTARLSLLPGGAEDERVLSMVGGEPRLHEALGGALSP